jgi:hypothetical protein
MSIELGQEAERGGHITARAPGPDGAFPWVVAIRALDHQRALLGEMYSDEQIADTRIYACIGLEAHFGDQSATFDAIPRNILGMMDIIVRAHEAAQDLPRDFVRHQGEDDATTFARRYREAKTHHSAKDLLQWLQLGMELMVEGDNYQYAKPEHSDTHAAVIGLALFMQGRYGPPEDLYADGQYDAAARHAFQVEASDLLATSMPLPWRAPSTV